MTDDIVYIDNGEASTLTTSETVDMFTGSVLVVKVVVLVDVVVVV